MSRPFPQYKEADVKKFTYSCHTKTPIVYWTCPYCRQEAFNLFEGSGKKHMCFHCSKLTRIITTQKPEKQKKCKPPAHVSFKRHPCKFCGADPTEKHHVTCTYYLRRKR